ncbi:hypothetical protein HZS_1255 [Henneguya salminicola]|nr:hypothetical protein HZS_1255 [Henneguya salminicola]
MSPPLSLLSNNQPFFRRYWVGDIHGVQHKMIIWTTNQSLSLLRYKVYPPGHQASGVQLDAKNRNINYDSQRVVLLGGFFTSNKLHIATIILSKMELLTIIKIMRINPAIGYIQSLTNAEDRLNQPLAYFNRTWIARNAEKAMAMLSRWVRYKKNETRFRVIYVKTKFKQERPSDPRECTEVWKAGLGEYRIRDLNDEINRTIKEKEKWEAHILAIGGPDYSKTNPKVLDTDGKELPYNKGYKYFGAARDLPGVKELFEQEPTVEKKKSRADLYKRIDAHYFGYLDEDDERILKEEADEELKARQLIVSKWKEGIFDDYVREFEVELTTFSEDDEDLANDRDRYCKAYSNPTDVGDDSSTPIVVPSQQDVENMLVEHKRKELLNRYVSESLSAQHEESKALLGL